MIFRPESGAAANTIALHSYAVKFGFYTGLRLCHSTGGFSTQPCSGSVDVVFCGERMSIWSPRK